MSDLWNSELSLPFPFEFMIQDTPRSLQTKNNKAREAWEKKVGELAGAHANELQEAYQIDSRPLAATIFYFPVAPMDGDVDNIIKPILDGMDKVIYPTDRLIERVVVQKFEPGVQWIFKSLTPILEAALEMERPSVYIRLDDDLAWREVP